MPWQLLTRAPVAQKGLVTLQQLFPVGACRGTSGFQALEMAEGGNGELPLPGGAAGVGAGGLSTGANRGMCRLAKRRVRTAALW